MDQNDRNLLEDSHAVNTIVPKGELTSKPARSARGMARGLTLLTMQRYGEFRLGVKTNKGILDVADPAALLQMHAPATVDDLLQMKMSPD